MKSTAKSPRITALEAAMASGEVDALPVFWREVADDGGPFIESDPEVAHARLVTFLWREDGPTSNVVLLEWMTDGDIPEKVMTHLPGSDLWYKTLRIRDDVRTTYRFLPNDSLTPRFSEADWTNRLQNYRLDPLNPRSFPEHPDRLEAEDRLWFHSSVLELPNASPLPEIALIAGAPRGVVEQIRWRSELLGNERDLWLYVPPIEISTNGSPLKLLLHFDGETANSLLRLPQLLDHLHHVGAIPPTMAVMIGNVDRGTELPCNPEFARALATELVPMIRSSYPVRANAADVIVAGQSYGGLAALWCAFSHPEAIGNVISQSGSFWWKQNAFEAMTQDVYGDAPDYEWLSGEIAHAERAPIRILMEAGTLESRSGAETVPSLVHSNRHMRDLLNAKGYPLMYREFSRDHNYIAWYEQLPAALTDLFAFMSSPEPA